MKCDVINDPATGQPMGFVCTGRGRTKYCPEPGCGRRADLLCDFPLRNGKTCDRPICTSHATHLAKEIDWCPPHQRWWNGVAGALGALAWWLYRNNPIFHARVTAHEIEEEARS